MVGGTVVCDISGLLNHERLPGILLLPRGYRPSVNNSCCTCAVQLQTDP